MTWMLTATGHEYHFTGARSMTDAGRPIHIEDIAHQLALINRFHGATSRPYSVAEHSLLVRRIAAQAGATPIVQLAALLHDAHECFTNDLASPAKYAINRHSRGCFSTWDEFEDEHAHGVREHFGLLSTFTSHRAALKHWDLVALATERRDLTPWRADTHAPWAVLRDGTDQAIVPHVTNLNRPERERWHWTEWRACFLSAYAQLRAEITQPKEVTA